MLSVLGRRQTEHGIHAGMLEIGVHHGKLFLLLATLRQEKERALAIDLFEDDGLNRQRWHSGRSTALGRHAERLGIQLDDREILQGDSMQVRREDILDRIGPARIVSVDGGHDYAVVESDLTLAAGVLADGGIIAVDDVFNTDWPDVRAATAAFLRAHRSAFGVFLVTRGKVYIARREQLPFYRSIAESDPLFAAAMTERTTFQEDDVLAMRWSGPGAVRRGFAGLAWASATFFQNRFRDASRT